MLRRYSSLAKCVKELLSEPPKSETNLILKGWVKSTRSSKNVAFLDLVDGTSHQDIKCVIRPPSLLPQVKPGSSIELSGKWSEGRGNQKYEVQVTENDSISLLGDVDPLYPLIKSGHSQAFLRSIPQYRWRESQAAAIMRFRSDVENSLMDYFRDMSFVKTHPPVITGADCEGAGEVFSISAGDNENGFFGKEAYLTVSAQLHLEVLCSALGRVWCLSPCFRAEESDTNRHLSEFWMLEAEVAFVENVNELTDFAEGMIKRVVGDLVASENMKGDVLLGKSKELGKSLQERWDMLLAKKWNSITYTEAVKILSKAYKEGVEFKYEPIWGEGLKTEHEKWLAGEYFQNPVFVTDYPLEEKAFYMKINNSDDAAPTVACFDLLVPEIGELIGGSLREHDLSKLLVEMSRRGMDSKSLEWYLDQRRNGTVPHGGFGMGFERLLLYLSGVENIKDVIPFSRSVNNCAS